ncbi:MAG: phosphoenolpyruvate carboxykinase (ATP) [Nanoarchaeota archaeon]|nr:phosphoenolpyruvate carboxykinase (ATP) [Nanoarchaeota archaeon]MBU4116186.1 phosphoenolpyruvate carboxykinase (ATP) [Nanoarchaeota archaeon]
MTEKYFQKFLQTANEVYLTARKQERLIENPLSSDLRKMVLEEPEIKQTKYGSLSCESEPKSRAAIFTTNNIDSTFGKYDDVLLLQAKESLSKEQLVSIDVVVEDGSSGTTARLIVPCKFAHLAYSGLKLFKQSSHLKKPIYQILMFFDDAYERNKTKKLNQKDITIRLAHSPEGRLVKIVRNGNYFGEWKKGVFAGENYRAKLNGNAIFLHAGCREDVLEKADGGFKKQSSLFVALSANGKTSLTCKVLAKKRGEVSWLIQDDGGTLYGDGAFKGFEAKAIFAKTERINPREQMEVYYGALKPNTFFENVYIDEKGVPNFYNLSLTANGRAVLERRDVMHASKNINVDKVDNLFIITRGEIIPAIAKLSAEEATAYMVLGQSTESSAGNPELAGKIVNEFFYDPFIAGNRAEHANLFYDIIKRNDINCYLLNTGHIGDSRFGTYQKITLDVTLGILDSVLRGGLENIWSKSKETGLLVPKAVRTVDNEYFHPEKAFPLEKFRRKQGILKKQREEIIESYIGLNKKVREVFI